MAAVTVRFKWLPDDELVVVQQEVRDSVWKMQETIAEALLCVMSKD